MKKLLLFWICCGSLSGCIWEISNVKNIISIQLNEEKYTFLYLVNSIKLDPSGKYLLFNRVKFFTNGEQYGVPLCLAPYSLQERKFVSFESVGESLDLNIKKNNQKVNLSEYCDKIEFDSNDLATMNKKGDTLIVFRKNDNFLSVYKIKKNSTARKD